MAKIAISPSTVVVNNIQGLADIVTGDAAGLKTTFDKTGADTKTYINSTLITELNGNTGANKIGLSNVNLSSDNVGDGIEEVRAIAVLAQGGTIVDNSLGNIKLASDVKIGSLATLTTTEKNSVIGALNEVDANADVAMTKATANEGRLNILSVYTQTTGSIAALVVNKNGTFDRTVQDNILNITPNVTNTGAITIAEDGATAKAIKKYNTDTSLFVDVEAGDVKKNQQISLRWDLANDFFVLAPKGGSNIKSVQRGSSTIDIGSTTKDITITGVDLLKSAPRITFKSDGWNTNEMAVRIKILNSTTIRITRYASTHAVSFSWDVIEFNNVKSIQYGTQLISTNEFNKTIISVNVLKSILFCSNDFSNALASDSLGYYALQSTLSSDTNINFKSGTDSCNVDWYVIEFN